jgi:hypothetical protein
LQAADAASGRAVSEHTARSTARACRAQTAACSATT